jgi:predicted DNA-binding protein with PD1-like motif
MIIGKLPYKSDLLQALTKVAVTQGIQAGVVQLIGSLGRAKLSHYDQKIRGYQELDYDASQEIVAATGNISLRDGKPTVHLHLAVADSTGRVVGGHCLAGCNVFAVEYTIWPFRGKSPERSLDPATGLLVWSNEVYTEEEHVE